MYIRLIKHTTDIVGLCDNFRHAVLFSSNMLFRIVALPAIDVGLYRHTEKVLVDL